MLQFFFKKSFVEWKKVCTFAPAFQKKKCLFYREQEALEIVKSDAEIAQLVEHDLAKVGVASSSLVFRSTKVGVASSSLVFRSKERFAEIAQLVEHDLAKVGVASSSLVFRSKGLRKPKANS